METGGSDGSIPVQKEGGVDQLDAPMEVKDEGCLGPCLRKVDIRLHEKGNSKSHGARQVYQNI